MKTLLSLVPVLLLAQDIDRIEFTKKHHKQPPTLTGTLLPTASAWSAPFNLNSGPLYNVSGNLAFDFPDVEPFVPGTDQASVNYVIQPIPVPSTILHNSTLSITVRIVTTGTPVFNYDLEPGNTCVFPASARFVVIQNYINNTGRWWSNPVHLELQQGMFVVTVPVAPDEWTDVVGESGSAKLAGWNAAFGNVTQIGLTFGGGCFFGHGVNVSGGTAQFQLMGYTLQ